LVHRPVAALHPPVAETVAAPTVAAPEVSRPMTADTPVAAGQQPTGPQEVKSAAEASHIPCWGVWLAADVSESMAWTLYRERASQFASLIGDRVPIVLFRQLPGLGNAKRYVIAIVDDDRAPLDKFCKKLTEHSPWPVGGSAFKRATGGLKPIEILGEASRILDPWRASTAAAALVPRLKGIALLGRLGLKWDTSTAAQRLSSCRVKHAE
jgi:hypothetical protein